MSPEDIALALYPTPVIPGGSDDILLKSGIKNSVNALLREGALKADGGGGAWDAIELRYIWCDQSVWEMPWGSWALRKELKDAKASGQSRRKVTFIRLRGANHFVSATHFD